MLSSKFICICYIHCFAHLYSCHYAFVHTCLCIEKLGVLFMNRKWVSTFPLLASQLIRFKGMQWRWQSFIFINILIISQLYLLILHPFGPRGLYLIKSPTTLDPGLLKSECLDLHHSTTYNALIDLKSFYPVWMCCRLVAFYSILCAFEISNLLVILPLKAIFRPL